ncbi:hypothetical protein E5S70_20260 [Ensifer adhaerens]|nr:hypothetical protein [Ensifer canadensis]
MAISQPFSGKRREVPSTVSHVSPCCSGDRRCRRTMQHVLFSPHAGRRCRQADEGRNPPKTPYRAVVMKIFTAKTGKTPAKL